MVDRSTLFSEWKFVGRRWHLLTLCGFEVNTPDVIVNCGDTIKREKVCCIAVVKLCVANGALFQDRDRNSRLTKSQKERRNIASNS
jgi:hypothetical protein